MDFYYRGYAVGTILDEILPTNKGILTFEPYRGPGHYEMRLEIKSKGTARCYYDTKDGRYSFDVQSYPGYGKLAVDNFNLSTIYETIPETLLEPWVSATLGAEKELEIEVGKNHPLFQLQCVPIARRIDKDEVLFQIAKTNRYAVVQLTWSGKTELDSKFPKTEMFNGIDEWIEKRMKKDNEEYMMG